MERNLEGEEFEEIEKNKICDSLLLVVLKREPIFLGIANP